MRQTYSSPERYIRTVGLSSFALTAKQSVAAGLATGDTYNSSRCIQGRFYVRSKI